MMNKRFLKRYLPMYFCLIIFNFFVGSSFAVGADPTFGMLDTDSDTYWNLRGDYRGHNYNPKSAIFLNYNFHELPAANFNNLQDFTIGGWVKLNAHLHLNTLLSVANSNTSNALIFGYRGFENKFEVTIGHSTVYFDAPLDHQNWHYWSAVRKGDKVTVYIDGSAIGTKTMTNATIMAEKVILGQEQDCLGGCFDYNQSLYGYVDDFYLNSEALPQTNISALFTESLWTFWNFDDGSAGHNPTEGSLSKSFKIETTGDLKNLSVQKFNNLSDFSISSWVKLNAIQTSGYQSNTLLSVANQNEDNALLIWYDGVREAFGVRIGASTKYYSTQVPYPSSRDVSPSDLAWHYWSFVRDGANVTVYIDGISLGMQTLNSGTITAQSVYIGQEQDCVGSCFDSNQTLYGQIEDLTLFSRAASSKEFMHYALTRLDTVIGYSSDALAASNGNIVREIEAEIEQINQMFIDNGALSYVNVKRIYSVSDDSIILSANNPEILQIEEDEKADIDVRIASSISGCGRTMMSGYAPVEVDYSCIKDMRITIGHEIAHLMGATHANGINFTHSDCRNDYSSLMKNVSCYDNFLNGGDWLMPRMPIISPANVQTINSQRYRLSNYR